ncbi:MAG TPA: hypothetical protein VG755_12895 [Nannocystaceae bacterium]|nr:hypothetical protein [Nannocystaceae bacterium]
MRIIAALTAFTLAFAPTIASAQEPSATPPVAATPSAASPPATSEPTATGTQPGWDDQPTATTTTSPLPPRVTPATAPAPDTLQPPPPPPKSRAGTALFATGISLVGVGALSLLFVAAPAALVKRTALDRAERDTAIGFSTSRQRYHRARVADNVMEGAFWVGISALAVGTVLAITGGVIKSRARSRAQARVGGGPGGLAIRF